MKLYISFLLVFSFFFFIGCSNSSINVISKKTNIKEESFSTIKGNKKVISNKKNISKKSDNYSIAMSYRRKLWLKGIDYIPWKSHLKMDIKFMPKLFRLTRKDVKYYYLDKSKIVVTRGKTFFSKKDNILFLNYKSNISFIKKFALKNLKYVKRDRKSKYFKKTKSTKYNKTQLLLKSNNLKGSYRLQEELNKLYSSEITRYNLNNYSFVPIQGGKIYKKGKTIYMPVNTLYQEMLNYFQKNKL